MTFPPLPSDLQWSAITSTISEFFVDSYGNTFVASGTMWEATSSAESLWASYGNYVQALVGSGWSSERAIVGHKIAGLAGDGPGSSSQGRLKVENDNIRMIWIWERNKNGIHKIGSPNGSLFQIFISNIVPISQIVSDYKPACN